MHFDRNITWVKTRLSCKVTLAQVRSLAWKLQVGYLGRTEHLVILVICSMHWQLVLACRSRFMQHLWLLEALGRNHCPSPLQTPTASTVRLTVLLLSKAKAVHFVRGVMRGRRSNTYQLSIAQYLLAKLPFIQAAALNKAHVETCTVTSTATARDVGVHF